MSPDACVHDASAVLAVLRGEPGGEKAKKLLAGGHVSAVNLIEVLTRLADIGFTEDMLDTVRSGLEVTVHPLTADQARMAALLRTPTRRRGLSLGDRACLALAMERGATAVTTDRAWADLDIGVKVLVLR